MARNRIRLLSGWPPPPADVEQQILEHLGRWTEPKHFQYGLEVGRMMAGNDWRPFVRWITDRLDEAQPDWRDHYNLERARVSRDDQLWLSEMTIATSHARIAVSDWRTPPDERAEAEELIAEAKEEARTRRLLPFLTRALRGDAETYVKCEIDDRGCLFLPERWHGWKLRDHNPT